MLKTPAKKIPDVFQPRRPWVQQTCIYRRDCCFIPSLRPRLFILHVGFNEECNKGMIRINSILMGEFFPPYTFLLPLISGRKHEKWNCCSLFTHKVHQESTYIKCCLTRPEFGRLNGRALRRCLMLGSWDLRMVSSRSNSECRWVAMREGSLTPLIQLAQNCQSCRCWQETLATDAKMSESHGGLLGVSVACLLYNQRVDQTPTGPTLASSRRLRPRGDHRFCWWGKVPYKP